MSETVKAKETTDTTEYEKKYSWGKTNESVKEAIHNLNMAFSRLKENAIFKNKYQNINIDDFLPLMIKESHLDNYLKSKTGALGYFQLKPTAITDAKKELGNLGINKSYNPNIPVDNCILGIIYFLHNKKQVENSLKGYTYGGEFELMAYNGGVGRVKSILISYKEENPKMGDQINWDNFVKWLVGKLEKNTTTKNTFSEAYNVNYRNWFSKDWSNDISTITFGNGVKTKRGKIYEMINYVEKINAIKSTNQEKLIIPKRKVGEEKIVTKITSITQRLSLAIEYDKGKKLPKMSGKKETLEGEKPDFYKWLSSIEVKNNKLKGKLFILDPGHGGADPGAIPIAKDETGKPIPYIQSDINENDNVVANGKGDGLLRAVESKITMDTCYRLAKLIKEHGGKVKITHYFQRGIDNGAMSKSSNPNAPGLLDEMQNYDTWSDIGGNDFTENSRKGLHKRVKVREKLKKDYPPSNTYFISIHADRLGNNQNVGINILHAKNSNGQKEFAKELAEAIGTVRNKKTTFGTRKIGIFILNPNFGAHKQNILVELGNMSNDNTSFALRGGEIKSNDGTITPPIRQKYAEGIFRGLLAVAQNR